MAIYSDIVKAVLCDDNEGVLEKEYKSIKNAFESEGIQILSDAFSAPEKILKSEEIYDVAFLDIEIGDYSGIKIARQLKINNKDILIVFITKHRNYVNNAMDVNASGYLMKPLNMPELKSRVKKLIDRLRLRPKTIELTVLGKQLSVSVEIADIIYISNTGRHTEVVTATHNTFTAKDVFGTVKDAIGKEVDCFATPHQSFYVNLNYVIQFSRESVTLGYAERQYNTYMAHKKYKEFERKFFVMANNFI